MSYTTINRTDTLTTEYDVEPGYVVACIGSWAGAEAGTLWELHRIKVEQPCKGDGFGRIVMEGDPELSYYGYKLKRDGTRLSAVPHLLFWIHSVVEATESHLAATNPEKTVRAGAGYREKRGDELVAGDVLALPFGKTATITEVKVGREYVTLRYDGLPKSRVGRYEPVMVQS